MANVFFFKFPLEDSLGGAEFHTLKLALHFKNQGHAVKLFTSDQKLFRLFEKHHLTRQRLFAGWEPTSKRSLLLWPLTFLIARLKFQKLLQGIPTGSMLFMQSLTEKLILTPLVLNSKILNLKSKIIWLEHKVPGRWLKLNPLKHQYLRLTKKVKLITVSNFAKQEFVKLGVPEKIIQVIYPGVPIQNTKYDIHNTKYYTIGLLSRLAPEKGVLRFLQTILPEIKKRPDWKILIGGEGEEENKITQFIFKNNLSAQIKLLGLVNNLDEFFSQISVLVYPTKVPEAFGVSVLEAAARGVPVVATKVGALPEIVDHEETGFLIRLGEEELWIEYLIKLAHPGTWPKSSRSAALQAQAFSEAKMLTGFEKLL